EVRAMMDAARQNKVVTQMGTQIHAGDNYRRVVEIVRSGMLGTVRRVHVWCERRPDPMFRVKETTPPPRGLNYDLWLGPAPAPGLSAIPQRHPPWLGLRLAVGVGFRRRRPRRHGLPLHGPAALGARPAASDEHRRHRPRHL